LLSGVIRKFPVTVYDSYNKIDIEISSVDELIELISKTYLDLSELSDKVKLSHVLDKLCIGKEYEVDTMQIADKRTLKIMKMYEFYKNNPSAASDSYIWFESVYMLSKLEPKGLF
jgi:hypothetical protein